MSGGGGKSTPTAWGAKQREVLDDLLFIEPPGSCRAPNLSAQKGMKICCNAASPLGQTVSEKLVSFRDKKITTTTGWLTGKLNTICKSQWRARLCACAHACVPACACVHVCG